MLYLIGLGLADERDISVKGLEIVKKAERVYLEAYTAVLLVDVGRLETFYGRSVLVADREMVESNSDAILADADKVDVAFLVVGDPFSATTHTDFLLRARALKIPYATLPNASILTAVGCTGLSLYTFGQTISLPFFLDNWRPLSFYDRLVENVKLGLHTLVLLDIKVKEPSLENLARGRKIYEPARFMTVAQAAAQLLEAEEVKGGGVCGPEALAVGVARVGSEGEKVVAGTLKELSEADLGPPLHSLVVLGWRTHEMEREFVKGWAVDGEAFEKVWQRDYQGKGSG